MTYIHIDQLAFIIIFYCVANLKFLCYAPRSKFPANAIVLFRSCTIFVRFLKNT